MKSASNTSTESVAEAEKNLDTAKKEYEETHETYKDQFIDRIRDIRKDILNRDYGDALEKAEDLTRDKLEEDRAAREFNRREMEYWQERIESNYEDRSIEHKGERESDLRW